MVSGIPNYVYQFACEPHFYDIGDKGNMDVGRRKNKGSGQSGGKGL
jgi:hypothetical protein